MNLSCNQCGHEFTEEELYEMLPSGDCPSCGSTADHIDTRTQSKDGETPFSYDPNQDYKTEK